MHGPIHPHQLDTFVSGEESFGLGPAHDIVQPEPVFARVPKMDLTQPQPQPQPQALPLPHTIVNIHPGVEWCPELSPPTRYSSSPDTVPGPLTPHSTPPLHPASIASYAGDLVPISYQYLPLPLPKMMPSKTIVPAFRPALEAMIIVDLGSVKLIDELIGWGYQGGHRFWNTLQDYIAEIEYGYQGPHSVPTKLHLRLCGKKDYRFYDKYDFRFGLVNDFLRGLKAASGLGADENLVLPTIEDVCRTLIERVHPIDRVYLAKSAVVPLPYFCHHIPTVLLATLNDECYYDADPRINHGLAVMSVERWMSALNPRGSAPVVPLPALPPPPKKMILPISVIHNWHDLSLLRHYKATPCTSFYLRGQCSRQGQGNCRYLHGEVHMEPEFLSRYREYIASQPCKTGGRCRNDWCLYLHAEKHPQRKAETS